MKAGAVTEAVALQNDEVFNIGLALKMYSQSLLDDVITHNVAQTCSYSQWASREILCDRNYMEVCFFLVLLLFRWLNWAKTCVCQVSHRLAKTDQAAKGQTQEEESNAVPEVSIKLIKGVAVPL